MVQLTNQEAVQSKTLWVSVHLYYEEPWEDFIRDAIIPLVKKNLKNGITTNYFFIRYFDKGPHIRLRFKVNSLKNYKILQSAIKYYFKDYFLSHPSVRDKNKYAKNVNKTLIKNNSLRFIKYRPEIRRYGGRYGILLSESLFQASSEAVFSNIDNIKNWNYDRALGAAIDMNIILLYGLKIGKEASIDLLNNYLIFSLQDIKKLKKPQIDMTVGEYDKNFQAQRNVLIPYVQNLVISINNNSFSGKLWMENWQKSIKELAFQIRKAKKQNLLKFKSGRLFWPMIGSYIHMTNNRLGIKIEDEPYVVYLIKRVLTEL